MQRKMAREHWRFFKGIIALYHELTSLKKRENETFTDYFLCAEENAAALKTAGEVISNGLLIAMSLKGIHADYSTFSTVITQMKDELTFCESKTALKSLEKTKPKVMRNLRKL